MKINHRIIRGRIAERLLLFIAEEPAQGSTVGKNKSFRRSLRNAVKGIALTFMSERNFRFEVAMTVVALVAGFLLGIGTIEWALVLTNIFFVLALEVKNTSMELTVDLVTSSYHYNAKGSKDAASGAVLLSAISSLCTGALVFGPRLVDLARSLMRGISDR
jgi:diacylglycerol kinase